MGVQVTSKAANQVLTFSGQGKQCIKLLLVEIAIIEGNIKVGLQFGSRAESVTKESNELVVGPAIKPLGNVGLVSQNLRQILQSDLRCTLALLFL